MPFSIAMLNFLRVNRTVNLAFGDSMGWFMQLIYGELEMACYWVYDINVLLVKI